MKKPWEMTDAELEAELKELGPELEAADRIAAPLFVQQMAEEEGSTLEEARVAGERLCERILDAASRHRRENPRTQLAIQHQQEHAETQFQESEDERLRELGANKYGELLEPFAGASDESAHRPGKK